MAVVAVALSGGVDSAVAAHLLQEAGHQVIGLTLDLGLSGAVPSPEEHPAAGKAVHDARQVAEQLGIPHYVFDFREIFASQVIQYFIEEYLQGRTPNPCVVCNYQIKFGQLRKQAQKLGADLLATGHYARIKPNAEGRWLLCRGKDLHKDQSYFLYTLNQEQLQFSRFPLGEYQKKDIRQIARSLNLKVAEKAESQEICFITERDYRHFLRKRVAKKIRPGPFFNQQNKKLGQHQGLPYYTVGQRKGLGLALGRPLYVVRIEPERNAVILGEEKELYHRYVWAEKNNFIPFEAIAHPLKVEAKVRYAAPPAEAVIYPTPDQQVRIEFVVPQRAIAPGQAVVYYQGDLVVGGGTIVHSES
ncbi:MAG: tRNA 2-thiouridine(34) synthase MnmA [Syntrophomonadaceae bacterium]|nr:tRNA 2-thiouridine(34) synthase MnmA [Syntrophomonadaceae bacterium]